jgi:hypothetical protein
MKNNVIRLTESDLVRIIERVISEQGGEQTASRVAAGWLTAGLSELPTIINGTGSSDVKVKQFCSLCAKYNAPITQSSNKKADVLRDAIQGVGTNESNIFRIFNSLTSFDEFCSVVKSYRSSYSVPLYTDLANDISQESEWVQIFRPLRNLALKKTQSTAKPSTPQRVK